MKKLNVGISRKRRQWRVIQLIYKKSRKKKKKERNPLSRLKETIGLADGLRISSTVKGERGSVESPWLSREVQTASAKCRPNDIVLALIRQLVPPTLPPKPTPPHRYVIRPVLDARTLSRPRQSHVTCSAMLDPVTRCYVWNAYLLSYSTYARTCTICSFHPYCKDRSSQPHQSCVSAS